MDYSPALVWLAWAAFAATVLFVVVMRYLPAVLHAPLPTAGREEEPERAAAPPAWLFCEEGDPLDQDVRWFPLRLGGRTSFGSLPPGTENGATRVYLRAYDLQPEHIAIAWDPVAARYTLEPGLQGLVRHNNEAVSGGTTTYLTDGDTVDLGEIDRFRFTLTGPPEER